MKPSIDQLNKRLELELGADAVKNDPSLLAAYTVDAKIPTLLCCPETPEQVAATLRLCSELDAAVTPWGGGAAVRIGNLPRQVDAVLELSHLDRVIEHDHANLTATVHSGITLASLQQTLAPQNQFLPFDPPHAARSTIGGIVAANLNGPRRMFYGSVRRADQRRRQGGQKRCRLRNVQALCGFPWYLGSHNRGHVEIDATSEKLGDLDRLRNTVSNLTARRRTGDITPPSR